MFARATIILLVMLNLGVALWWATRAQAPTTVAPYAPPAGAATLQLADETAPAAAAMPAAQPQSPSTPPSATAAAVPAERCRALGPFADAAAANAARARLPSGIARSRLREAPGAPRGWRVEMPALADRAAAAAMAERLTQAGFTDLYVVTDGVDANSIALGRYSDETAARSHASALRTAGFEVRIDPVDGDARHWVDAAADAAFDFDAAAAAIGAGRAESIDCTSVR